MTSGTPSSDGPKGVARDHKAEIVDRLYDVALDHIRLEELMQVWEGRIGILRQGHVKDVVPLASKFIADHVASYGLETGQIGRYWLHQANLNMNELIAHRLLGRAATREQAPEILDEYANTSSAGSVIAFHKHHQDFQRGEIGVLCAFGAGYSVGNVVLKRV